jgi:16S rRNA (adenine1518-N6/adenine1519-N6)-dimethyltransferase
MRYTLNKSLGQHFLHDENMCSRVVASLIHTPGMQLLEVGPGGGAITKYILNWDDISYKAIEIDPEKVAYLHHHYPELNGKILQQDILKAEAPFDSSFSIIGNFPYNISSPILFRVLEWEPLVTEVIGMFQKEVAQRIAAPPGSRTYGILSVLMQAFYQVDYLFDVPPGCFTPPPKVVSGVLRFSRLGDPHHIENKKRFIMLVKTAFNQRRKTLHNALKSITPLYAPENPFASKRAEQLSVADFVTLYQLYES